MQISKLVLQVLHPLREQGWVLEGLEVRSLPNPAGATSSQVGVVLGVVKCRLYPELHWKHFELSALQSAHWPIAHAVTIGALSKSV